MPRQRSSGRAPARPTLSKPAAAPMAQQTRPATTYAPAAAPPAAAPAAAAAPASSGPGLFGQMASTAAGVAIGSSIGHAIGGMFSGGSAQAPLDASPQTAAAQAPAQNQVGNCSPAAQQFTKCMDEHSGNLQICNWYLDQLKACQAAAAPY
ncbi:hypothetical protein BROUX41_001858 [Berkeleyomyces rouxiae]|uniref:uncharacterized protein n=1 Tax=Berkeleyomyces rouxiae TaxID=2035830 RepID=UPI003B78296C